MRRARTIDRITDRTLSWVHGRLVSALAVAALTVSSVVFAQDAAEPVVNVYTARHYPTDEALYRLFTERTGIRVAVIEGDSDELLVRMASEGASSPADVFVTVDVGRLWRAESRGILAPVDSPVLDAAVPAALRHPDGLWFGLTQRVRGLVVARDIDDAAAVTRYEDLAAPDWRGRVCVRSSNNVYNQSLLASWIERFGVDRTETWAAGVVANFARPPQGGDTDQIKAVAAGECDVALVNHYYYARLATSADPSDRAVAEAVMWVFPNQGPGEGGAHVNVAGAGLVATAPHPAEAVAFLEFLVGSEAQEAFAVGNLEYPVVDGVPVADVLARWGDFVTDEIAIDLYGVNNPEAVRIFDRVGWR